MESQLYDLLSSGLLQKWRAEAEKSDNACGFRLKESELENELRLELSEKGMDLFTAYSLTLQNRMDYLYYYINVKILNLGIQIGMDLQKAFTESEE